jgi:hypothetical protein
MDNYAIDYSAYPPHRAIFKLLLNVGFNSYLVCDHPVTTRHILNCFSLFKAPVQKLRKQ